MMNFSEALEELKKGKRIKRSIWGGYWFLSKNPICTEKLDKGYERSYQFQNGLIVAVLKDHGGCAPATPYQADLLADDWQVVEEDCDHDYEKTGYARVITYDPCIIEYDKLCRKCGNRTTVIER